MLALPRRFFVAIALWLPAILAAQTQVTGSIGADAHWTIAGSPYVLSGEVRLINGATLSVDPGVTVYMAAGAALVVQAGRVLAVGTAAQRIQVLSDKARTGQTPQAGDWSNWAFGAGTTGHRIEQVTFQHGRGLVFRETSAELNFVDLRGHAGPAIDADLATSLVGVGNQASGNTVNGVVLPAGDITGSVRWGLRGIPFVVAAGTVSVGASPRIDAVSPAVLQQGDSLPLTVTGSRLAGAVSALSSNPGVTLQLQPGATDAQAVLLATVAADAAVGAAGLRLLVDAGEAESGEVLLIKAPEPRLLSVAPTSVFTDRGPITLAITGQNLRSGTVAELDGTPLATTFASATSATATLPNQTSAAARSLRLRTPDASAPGGSLLSSALTFTVLQPQPSLAPTTVSMFEGNTQVMRLTLPFPAPAGGLRFDITSSAPLVMTAQSSVTVPANATFAEFDVRGAGVGVATLTVSRLGWTSVQVPVTVIDPPRRVDLTPILSELVGVVVGAEVSPTIDNGPYIAKPLGIIVGAAARGFTPAAGVVGTQVQLVITGSGLSGISQVSAEPSTGLSFSSPAGSGDGTQLTVQITIAADAPKTVRRIVLTTAAGELPFASPAASQFLVTSPPPEIVSISPQVVVAGAAAATLTIRGQNFRDIQGLRFDPPADLSLVGIPSANADGTVLTAQVLAASGAASGPRTVIVVAAGGESAVSASAANTIQIARSLGTAFEAIVSQVVGVEIGATQGVVDSAGPYNAASVGVVVGLAAQSMSPKTATRGGRTTLVVQGAGLSAVTSVSIESGQGLVLQPHVVASDGRSLTLPVDVDFNAPLTQRRVVLNTASGVPVPFAIPGEDRLDVVEIVGQRFESMVSLPVGVQVGPDSSAVVDAGPYAARPVGVSVGAAAHSLTPSAGVIGTAVNLRITGTGLAGVTAVEAIPSTGLSFGAPQADDGQVVVQLAVAADAPKTVRRIVLRTASGEVLFADPQAAQFLVTSPIPMVESITPQVVVAGQPAVTLTLRGQNLRDILGIRFDPPSDLSVQGTPSVNTDGTLLQVLVQAGASAISGPRTLIVVAAAGESSAVPAPANTLQVARVVGTAFESIVSPLVGLQVGADASATEPTISTARDVGVVVGAGVLAVSPAGSVKGAQGNWVFQGAGLQGVTAARLVGPDGSINAASNLVSIGGSVIGDGGTTVTVPYTVDALAPNRRYRVELLAGSEVIAEAQPGSTQWQVVDLPRIDSVSPTVLQQGRSYSFVVRGAMLSDVTEIVFEPDAGIQSATGKPVLSTDAFGQLLTVPILVAPTAATGPRVVRLRYPGGLTTEVPTSANVINVVP